MTTTYNQFTKQTASRKITLVHLHMKREVKLFSTTGMLHTRTPSYFVTEVIVNGTSYTSVAGTPSSNQFNYNPTTNLLTVFFDGTLSAQEVILQYRLFFADYDVKQTHDLTTTGHIVHYKSRVKAVPGFRTELTFANSNKSIIGSGNLVLDNRDGLFHGLLKDYRFNNKQFAAYSWSDTLAFNEHKLVFRGVVHRATLNNDELRFQIKDDIFNLNNIIQVEQFGTVNGVDLSNTFKKRVFGRVNGMRVQSTDLLGTGYDLTGTISGNLDSNVITGLDTLFLDEIVPGDQLIINDLSLGVKQINSNTELILTDTLDNSLSNVSVKDRPTPIWYNTNRTFSISSRALKEFSQNILGFVSNRRLRVTDADGYESGDKVTVLGEEYIIDRVSKVYTDSPTNTMTNDVIVLTRTLSPNNFPSIGTPILKRPIQDIKIAGTSILEPDFTIDNTSNGCNVILSNDTEFNLAPELPINSDLTAVANTNIIVSGIPSTLTLNFEAGQDNLYGTSIRLATPDDTSTATGDFIGVVQSNLPTIQFTEAEESTTLFIPTTLYQITDGTNAGDFFVAYDVAFGTEFVTNIGSDPRIIRVDNIQTIGTKGHLDAIATQIKQSLITNNDSTLFDFLDTDALGIWVFVSNTGGPFVNPSIIFPRFVGMPIQTAVIGRTPRREISLSEFVSSRDYIKVIGQLSFNEVFESSTTFVLTKNKFTTTVSGDGVHKNPDYIEDSTLVTVSAIGETEDGTTTGQWVKTSGDAIKKVLIENNLSDFINTASFTEANVLNNITCGIYVPYMLSGRIPPLIDFVDKLTQTDLASIGLDNEFKIKLQVLTGFTPSTLETIRLIRNDNLISRAKQTVEPSSLFKYAVATINGNYDFGEDDPNSKLFFKIDQTLKRLIDLDTSEDVDLYMARLLDANIISSRYLDYAQRLNRVVSFEGSLALSDVEIGDTVLLDLLEIREDRVNQPFLGMVTQIARNGKNVSLRVEDFGELFFKSATYADDTIPNFVASTPTQKLLNTYYTDDIGLVNNDESTFGQNIYV